jgi:hypothetical protein
MAQAGPQDEIARLEEEIDRLADAAERCRKIILAAKIAIVVGAAWMVAARAGGLPGAGSLIGATAALVGGIVAFGTNIATLRQFLASLAAAEQSRAQLIGRMQLRVIPGGREELTG